MHVVSYRLHECESQSSSISVAYVKYLCYRVVKQTKMLTYLYIRLAGDVVFRPIQTCVVVMVPCTGSIRLVRIAEEITIRETVSTSK